MNNKIYLLVQALFWAIIWLLLSLNKPNDLQFLIVHIPAYLCQVVVIFLVTYVLAPKLLLPKKYLYFLLISIPLLLGLAYLSSLSIEPMEPIRQRPKFPRPAPFFILVSNISAAFILSVLIEAFIAIQKKDKVLAFAKAELLETELKMLKMQVNPHFLFNSLNNIYALSISNSDKTPESIHSLSEMLRYVIYECEKPKVPVEREIKYIENYIELFKLRSSETFNISFINNLVNTSILVAPMLFIIFIENALKHSGIEKRGETFVAINLKSENDALLFTVENSLPKEKIYKDVNSGIGLNNAKKRLEIYYPDRHDLIIEDNSTYKVILKLYPDE